MKLKVFWFGIILISTLGFKFFEAKEFIIFQLESPRGLPELKEIDGNEYTKERYDLGRKLFFDPILSIDSSISCASCHKPELAFADNRSLSPGAFGRPGTRNAPSLINVAYHPHLLREGSIKTLEMQVLVPIQEENEFAHNIVDIAKQLKRDSIYVEMSTKAYNREIDAFVITRSIGVFQRTLLAANSKYDDFRFGQDANALNESEQRGKALFFSRKTNCFFCHSGVNFTNYLFENTGLYKNYKDDGRYRFTKDSSDIGKFKVPSLRNVQITKPYMHDGSFQSLEAVVEHYNSGGKSHSNKNAFIKPLGLTEQEKSDLISFLKSLTDSIYL
jgi:cytochrome c peroxidase